MCLPVGELGGSLIDLVGNDGVVQFAGRKEIGARGIDGKAAWHDDGEVLLDLGQSAFRRVDCLDADTVRSASALALTRRLDS
jgi:hypothetical protein